MMTNLRCWGAPYFQTVGQRGYALNGESQPSWGFYVQVGGWRSLFEATYRRTSWWPHFGAMYRRCFMASYTVTTSLRWGTGDVRYQQQQRQHQHQQQQHQHQHQQPARSNKQQATTTKKHRPQRQQQQPPPPTTTSNSNSNKQQATSNNNKKNIDHNNNNDNHHQQQQQQTTSN